MKRKRKGKKDAPWDTLRLLIEEYANAVITESWKGGGDPIEIPLLEAKLAVAKLQLEIHIDKMQKECEEC